MTEASDLHIPASVVADLVNPVAYADHRVHDA